MLKKLFSVHLPLFAKIFISSVALVVLLSVSISVAMNIVTQNLLSDEIVKYHSSYLKKIDSNLTYIIQKVEHLIDNIELTEDIDEYDTYSSYQKYKLSEEITEQLNDIIIYSNISGVTLIADGKSFIGGQYYNNDEFLNEEMWPEDSAIYARKNNQDNSYVTFLKRVSINSSTDGLMIITISPVLNAESYGGAGVFAIDTGGEIVWMKNTDKAQAEEYINYRNTHKNVDSTRETINIGESRFITLKSGTGHVELVMCLNNNILEKRGDEILRYIVTMTIGMIFLCVIFSWILSRTITTRINVLKNKMQNFELNTHIEEGKDGISLKKKIMLYYIAVCFLPIAVMSVVYYGLSMRIMEEEVSKVFEQSVGYIGDNIIMTTDGYVIDGRYIANDEYIQDMLSGNAIVNENKIQSVVKIAAKDNGCENLVIYDKEGKIIYTLKDGAQKLSEKPEFIQWIEPDMDEFNQKVAGVIIPINGNDYREEQYMQCIGYLKITFKESIFEDIISLNESDGAKTYMLNNDNKIIISSDFSDIGNVPDEVSDDGNIMYKYHINDSWKICGIVQTDMLFSNRTMILLYLLMIYMIVLMLIAIFSNQISRIIITPMKILNDNIQDNMQNRAKSRIHLKTGDEIEELCKSFNIMNDEIDRLVNNVYEAEMAKKELEMQHKEANLNALQAQINPHFLYNTFETTNWLIKQNQNEEAVNMITRLSDIFRLGINRGKNTFSLEKEIRQAQAYIDIQKMRYAEKLCVVWEYEDSILECEVVKTILQPILENAIYHGIEPKEDGGEIEISIDRNGEELEIRVLDTGVGIEEEKCRKINSDLANNENKILKSIGLKNVNDRIKLMYGEDYGIEIESVFGKYTEVLIRMPYVKEKNREEEDV